MSKTLFIKANNRPSDQAVSVKMYDAFVASYKEHHPNQEFSELDLFQEHLPYIDNVMLTGIFKASQGQELTTKEQELVKIADKYLNQFLAAEKIVFAFPVWNETVPAVLHTYIDYLNRIGKTFRYSSEGPIGLAAGKKVLLLNARGGDYTRNTSKKEMAVNFMLTNLQLFGITDVTTVITEGHNQYPERKNEIIQQGIENAAKAAVTF
jgi:FMN-dependent NADH-azoreductase